MDPLDDRYEPFGEDLSVVVGADELGPCGPHSGCQGAIAGKASDRVPHRRRILRWDRDAAPGGFDQAGELTGGHCGDDRFAGAHVVERLVRKGPREQRLVLVGQQADVRPSKPRRHVLLRHRVDEDHILQFAASGLGLQGGLLVSPSDQHKPD